MDPPLDPADFNEANQFHAAHYGALVILLLDKGIITQDEYNRAYIQAQHALSQAAARKRDGAQSQKDSP
jgi:hypothetical protein